MNKIRELFRRFGSLFRWKNKKGLEKKYYYVDKEKEKQKQKVYIGGG